MALQQALYDARSPDQKAVVIADTWMLVGVARRELDALLAAHFLQEQGKTIRIPHEVSMEYAHLHDARITRQNIPLAPLPLDAILQGFQPLITPANGETVDVEHLSPVDVEVILAAEHLAQENNPVQIVTGDNLLTQTAYERANANDYDLHVVNPWVIRKTMAPYLSRLNLELIADREAIGYARTVQGEGTPYLVVRQKLPLKYGKKQFSTDFAGNVEIAPPGSRIRAQRRKYGIALLSTPDLSVQAVREALGAYAPDGLKGTHTIGFLPASQNKFPYFFRIKSEGNAYTHTPVKWAHTDTMREPYRSREKVILSPSKRELSKN